MAVPDDVESLIDGAPLMAHLATSVDDRPHVAPVWYAYGDGEVRALTGGRKLANVRRNPRVSLSIEKSAGGDAEWMVVLQGRATVEEDSERRRQAARTIFPKYLGHDPEEWDDYYRESIEDSPRTMLVEVDVGSAASQRY